VRVQIEKNPGEKSRRHKKERGIGGEGKKRKKSLRDSRPNSTGLGKSKNFRGETKARKRGMRPKARLTNGKKK